MIHKGHRPSSKQASAGQSSVHHIVSITVGVGVIHIGKEPPGPKRNPSHMCFSGMIQASQKKLGLSHPSPDQETVILILLSSPKRSKTLEEPPE